MNKRVKIFTDGASLGNPGPGGFGVVMIYGSKIKELSQGYRFTTNNRMEILAVIEAIKNLKTTKDLNIEIFTDSQLIFNAVEKKWIKSWKQKGWKKSDKNKVLNQDLWQELHNLIQNINIKFNWIKGHSNITENERCDELAKDAANSDNKLIDEFYENETNGKEKQILIKQKNNFWIITDKNNNSIKLNKSELIQLKDYLYNMEI